MTQFPLPPIYVGKIDSQPDELKPFKQRLVQLLASPQGMQEIPQEFPYRACTRVGQPEYAETTPSSGITANRLFQNAVLEELCCGIRYQIDRNNQVRFTINRGGEYAFVDPEANAFVMIWVNSDKKLIQYKAGPQGQTRFCVPTEKDLLTSITAEGFFEKQRKLAGCTIAEMNAVRRDRARSSAADNFNFG
jgi:hypothetical protein